MTKQELIDWITRTDLASDGIDHIAEAVSEAENWTRGIA